MSKADDFRKDAEETGKRASYTKSRKKAADLRKRQEGLIQLAENEEWLEGNPRAYLR